MRCHVVVMSVAVFVAALPAPGRFRELKRFYIPMVNRVDTTLDANNKRNINKIH